MIFDFKDKVVVITGAARGIGRAIATSFGSSGANVCILDLLEHEASETCGAVRASGGKAFFFQTDVSDPAGVNAVTDAIFRDLGHVDVLVNNAGIVMSKPFIECETADFDRIIAVNIRSDFLTCRRILPSMMERRYGKIVNIASIAGKTGGGFFGNTLYGVSKAGVIALTKGLAREAGPFGVNVNSICPGPTETMMIAQFQGEIRERLLATVPLRKFGQPQDVANLALFLASDAASHITGEISDVDGGIMRDN